MPHFEYKIDANDFWLAVSKVVNILLQTYLTTYCSKNEQSIRECNNWS